MDLFDLILPLVGLAIIAAAWAFHLNKRKKADASANWPVAQGRITCSQVVEKSETDSYGDTSLAYHLELAYDYSVAGKAFTGERLSFASDKRFAREGEAKGACERYPVNATVQVRYNPQDPKEAVLESKRPGITVPVILTVTGLVLILIGFSV